MQTQQIGFGGGCHWCTEAIFQHLVGVEDVQQGFIASTPPHDALSEAIQLRFDPSLIPLDVLIAAHLHTHSSASNHPLRHRYRSAIYTTTQSQTQAALDALQTLQSEWDKPLITSVLPLERFELNSEQYHSYYLTRPDAPFCKTQIDPKLAKLRMRFSNYYISHETSH